MQPNKQTFPSGLDNICYTSNSQFNLNSYDQSLSNFFYQMSRTSANPFRMTFGYFPTRINIPHSMGSDLRTCGAAVLNQIRTNYPDFDWSPYDQRTNQPNFLTDNSNSPPDGVLDYVVICFRTFNSCGVTMGVNSGLAGNAMSVNFPATANRPQAYNIAAGHIQSGGSLSHEVFLHEFAHNLYNAPHLLGANNTFGSRFHYTHGWGMMANFYTLYSANAWERWYNGWTELKTGSNQAVSDVQNASSLTPTGGYYTLRDYVTTGDVMRVRIPGTSQYIWLENRARTGVCDLRKGWNKGGDGLY